MTDLLLDSHAFLWALTDDPRLGATVRARLQDPRCVAHLSAATIWELAIKASLGRLILPMRVRDLLHVGVSRGGVKVLDITAEHAARASELPMHHKDPFDRLLVAQAQAERLTLATRDEHIPLYDVACLW